MSIAALTALLSVATAATQLPAQPAQVGTHESAALVASRGRVIVQSPLLKRTLQATGAPQTWTGKNKLFPHASLRDFQGLKGNPLLWTMTMVYGGLAALAILIYLVWGESDSHIQIRKLKAEEGLPPGYVL
eukprot:TRINITY_DN14560_c0_g1_i3.p1 TRINITY_DN14560_c0_g1~~TRINITY_DN14560_c0_g1_i3.p1  ORF type:complete len:154 (+),score=13.07 TRINITY_DN14560_c0_g1_i3:70-462(+)